MVSAMNDLRAASLYLCHERERGRERDRDTERQRQRDRDRETERQRKTEIIQFRKKSVSMLYISEGNRIQSVQSVQQCLHTAQFQRDERTNEPNLY